MGEPMQTIYPFGEIYKVTTNGATDVDVWDIPAGTFIEAVLLEVDVAAIDTGGANILCGDNDTDDGFILAAIVCGVTAGTIYGDDVAERGEYLNSGDAAGGRQHAGSWKSYTTAGKTLKIKCSAALDTEATIKVYVIGHRYKV